MAICKSDLRSVSILPHDDDDDAFNLFLQEQKIKITGNAASGRTRERGRQGGKERERGRDRESARACVRAAFGALGVCAHRNTVRAQG